MSGARIPRPKLLDPSLRPAQKPVDQKSVGVGRYLRRDSLRQASERGCQSLSEPEHALEARPGHVTHMCVTPVAEYWCLERARCDVCLWADRWEN